MKSVSRWYGVLAAPATGALLYFGSGLSTLPALIWWAPLPVLLVVPHLRVGAAALADGSPWP